jgi:branched-subunit amino acid permease
MLFFLLSHDDCYLGRMYEYLVLLVNFNIHMLTPMILQMALEVAGPILVRKYPVPIRAIALQLADPNSSFNQKITSYFTTFEVL